MIAAILSADNAWGIGKDGDLLISIPEDLKRFSRITRGAAVVMGRKTWDSLPKKPLPRRRNIIISRKYGALEELEENVFGAGMEEIRAWLEDKVRNDSEEPVFIIGGGQIYEALLPYCSRVYVTRIDKTYDADTYFPDLDASDNWEISEVSEEQVFVRQTEEQGEMTEETIRYRYVTYDRSEKENVNKDRENAETTRRKKMNYTNVIEDIDPLYYTECEHKGKVERIDYKSSFMGRPMDKYAFVYTPYDYDPEKAYEILYLIHGGLEYAEKYLYENGEENKLKRAVDHMIDRGEIPPVIIVTPSEYPDNKIPETHEGNNGITTEFHKELVNDLIPVVEGKYKTFNSREHRGVMGWSMGSMTTWSVFMNRIDTFSRFGFLSAHAPALSGGPGGLTAHYTREWANDTCKAIAAAIDAQNVKKSDYSIYAITGSEDIVFEPFNMQMGVLQSYTDYFDFYGENQNACFLVWKDGEHHTQWRLQYTINAIRQFYR